MCDFHNFGLIFANFCETNALFASKVFEQRVPEGYPECRKKFQTTLILAFEANSALSRKNETKIVKITHSALCIL